eukprot:1036119-Amphidinium_carterae.1
MSWRNDSKRRTSTRLSLPRLISSGRDEQRQSCLAMGKNLQHSALVNWRQSYIANLEATCPKHGASAGAV